MNMLQKWLAELRRLDEDEATAEYQVVEHFDTLGDVITSMAMDSELCGIDSAELKVLQIKQHAYRRRSLETRWTVLDELMIQAAKLERHAGAQVVAITANAVPVPAAIDDDTERRQKGVDTWNAGSTWRQVAELLEGTTDIDQSDIARIKGEVKRFAKRTGQDLRKSPPGKKRESKSNE